MLTKSRVGWSIFFLLVVGWIVITVLAAPELERDYIRSQNEPSPGLKCIENCARGSVWYSSKTIRVFKDVNRGILCYQQLSQKGMSCLKE